MVNDMWKKGMVLAIMVLFVGSSVTPGISGYNKELEKTDSIQDENIVVNITEVETLSTLEDPTWQWAKSAGGSSADYGWSVGVDGSGNTYITGYFHGSASFGTTTLNSQGDRDVFVAKLGEDNGNQPPTVEITYPVEGQTVSGTITITGTADDLDGTVQQVEVKIDDGSWETATGTTSWSYEWDTTTVPDGPHIIYARSYDGEYYSDVDSVNVNVENNQPPTVDITYPNHGQTVSGTITITGTASDPDGTVSYVEVKIDNGNWHTVSGTTSWSDNWNTNNYPNGQHTIYARSYDGEDYSEIDSVTVNVDNEENDPPESPSDPMPDDGETDVDINADLSWTCSDPDGDDLVYDVYFEADDPEPDILVSDNQTETTFDPGEMEKGVTYYWQINAKDEHGASTMGPVWSFTTEEAENQPPEIPTISGETNGKAGIEYEYTFNAEDPNGDDVKYHIDWDDSNSETTDFSPSGTDVKVKHTWTDQDTYTIKVTAEDTNGLISPEGTLIVTMPRNRAINTPFLRFLEDHPHLFPILRQLLGL